MNYTLLSGLLAKPIPTSYAYKTTIREDRKVVNVSPGKTVSEDAIARLEHLFTMDTLDPAFELYGCFVSRFDPTQDDNHSWYSSSDPVLSELTNAFQFRGFTLTGQAFNVVVADMPVAEMLFDLVVANTNRSLYLSSVVEQAQQDDCYYIGGGRCLRVNPTRINKLLQLTGANASKAPEQVKDARWDDSRVLAMVSSPDCSLIGSVAELGGCHYALVALRAKLLNAVKAVV